ncbi:MAG TPA: anthranilate phosphoribosyltransferase, partial [Ramlibacter sp.]
MMEMKAALHKIADGRDLTGEEMRDVMRIIMSGEASAAQVGAFLMGMRVKGETVGEIAAAVSILREQMVTVEAP